MVKSPPPAPKAKMPTVELPAAAPNHELVLDAVAAALVQPEYVYLLRVVVLSPKANIPTVEVPAADPSNDTTLDAVATAFVSPE